MYIGLLATSVLSFSGGIYFSVEAEKIRQRTLAFLEDGDPNNYTPSDLNLISENNKKIDTNKRTSVILYTSGALFLGLSVYFFVKDLQSRTSYIQSKRFSFSLYPQYDPSQEKHVLDWYFRYTYLI